MKKLGICLFILLTGVLSTVFSKENIINEISLNNNKGAMILNIESEYTGNSAPADNYIDIKNAKLADSFNADYTDKTSTASIVVQQIGSKVRISLIGKNINEIKTQINPKQGKPPVDWTKSVLVAMVLTFVALKCYSDTIKLASDIENIKYPSDEVKMLNRGMLKIKKRPEIVLNSLSNPVKEDVYIDFQYAKDRKNIKIAI